ncbi:hypothetical protein [Flavobacterium yafengii]|jgi:hypothetical protein|uniref:hypothetical protein n=1 Tax=Flavobacterium yafengii TaxID=3041253 RepID=UPI0024A96807|nr:hypothetical protein [Flavobacterium yafengii]MDI5897292.1 hypothetical protein [Flavobacterium yafengii]
MNWFRKTVVFIGLLIAFLFALSASEAPIPSIQLEKSNSSVSVGSIHSSDFIQPQVSNTFTSYHKTPDYTIAKYLENFLIAIPDFKISTFFIRFAKQDINRCEMVSLLLFPFHFFW